MSKLSRTKGHSFERSTAIALRHIFPQAKRQLEYQIDDCLGVDIANAGPFRIQCKKTRKYVSINTIEEIQCSPELGDVPVLVASADHKPAMAVLPFEDFVRLLEKAYGLVPLPSKPD
jgi:hypothetical protein